MAAVGKAPLAQEHSLSVVMAQDCRQRHHLLRVRATSAHRNSPYRNCEKLLTEA
jgi:hypothetical protein